MMETTTKSYPIQRIRQDFPILNREVHGKPLVYLDNAATSQKPRQVISAIEEYYTHYNANIHRGVHQLATLATTAYEESRQKIADFIGAAKKEEIIFTSGTTDSINLAASTLSRAFLKEGDEVLISAMEHHSNIVPWQLACEYSGAKLKVIPMMDNGELDQEAYATLLNGRTRVVALVHVSNSLGTINPVKQMIRAAHDCGAIVLLDGAQSTPHLRVDMKDLDCDLFAFSGHKVCGPTGIGVLYGKESLLEKLPPYRGGGEMIETVTFEKTTYNALPYKFEAGTPHIEGGIVLGMALDYLNAIGHEAMFHYETELLNYQEERLQEIDGIKLYGEASHKVSLSSFLIDGIHPYDLGALLDQMGIAVRTGHHCTQPVMERFGIPGTVRSSLAFYNTKEEVDRFVDGLHKAVQMLR